MITTNQIVRARRNRAAIDITSAVAGIAERLRRLSNDDRAAVSAALAESFLQDLDVKKPRKSQN